MGRSPRAKCNKTNVSTGAKNVFEVSVGGDWIWQVDQLDKIGDGGNMFLKAKSKEEGT
jgi:hypothetical protein